MTTVAPMMPFVDLAAQQARIADGVRRRIEAVLQHGHYIDGPEVAELEAVLAARAGVDHVVCCASGTDALVLAMLALGVRPGDVVAVPAFTFTATAEAVAFIGAVPAFVDVEPDCFDLDPDSLQALIDHQRAIGAPVVGVIPVDLFGMPANHDAIAAIALDAGMWVLTDAAQSFGSRLRGRAAGSFGDITATSFFPAKPLGCYGDGGALFTDDASVADVLRSLRNHGAGADRYDNVRIGMTGRLDTVQAAVLLAKLEVFDDELERRDAIAGRYDDLLGGMVTAPARRRDARSAWAQYTVLADDRDGLADRLALDGIPTAIYYSRSLSAQPAYRSFPVVPGGVPVSDALCSRVLSLPMHPYLDDAAQDRVVASVAAWWSER
jgi:dTDP-4-amino-4,6-dideoxygalactose transaminase